MESAPMRQYRVYADRGTGEWLCEPEYVGEVSRAEWLAKDDTEEVHFDTYEHFEQAGDIDSETRAIEVVWE